MEDALFDEVLKEFRSAGASMRCNRIGSLLKSLGFVIKDGKRGGHKVFFHDHLPDFTSKSYNCDHGKNPQVKKPYIKNIIRVLEDHEAGIRCWLEQQPD